MNASEWLRHPQKHSVRLSLLLTEVEQICLLYRVPLQVCEISGLRLQYLQGLFIVAILLHILCSYRLTELIFRRSFVLEDKWRTDGIPCRFASILECWAFVLIERSALVCRLNSVVGYLLKVSELMVDSAESFLKSVSYRKFY